MFRKREFFQNRHEDIWRAGAFLALGAGAGAGLMYLLDPERGTRRRAAIRDKTVSTVHEMEKTVARRGEDLANRITGVAAEARGLLRRGPVPDETLAARVRAELGRLVSHPRAVEVQAHEGIVTLRGAVAPDEMAHLLDGIKHVGGVAHIENQLAGAA
ncbi:MAG: BON domain-containing protein [Bryobacteraceae bacterium]|nr:BON domain-containing protein [Bryobacteraceae bacterium]